MFRAGEMERFINNQVSKVFNIAVFALEQYNKFIGKEQAAGKLGKGIFNATG